MEDPPIAIHAPHNSKKRLFGGSSSSSSSFMDPDVIEIPPPSTWKSKPLKQKSVVGHDVIVVDDEDSDDIMIIEEKVASSSKGKKPMHNYPTRHKKIVNGGVFSPQAKDYFKGDLSSHVTVIDDDFYGMDLADVIYDDDCAMLQAHFDSLDIPTVPWWLASAGSGKQAVSGSSSVLGMQNYSKFGNSEVDHNSKSQISVGPLGVEKSVASNSLVHELKVPSLVQSNPGLHLPGSGMIPPMPQWPPVFSHGQKKQATLSHHSHKLPPFGNPYFNHHFQGDTNLFANHIAGTSLPSGFITGFDSHIQNPSVLLDETITAEISPPSTAGLGDTSEDPILKKLELFKKFDTVEDYADHHYSSKKESVKQSKSWQKKIQAEWKMLENDLPDTIFVRVYEARMDLLRAAIVGADGTPYHDGLFFFDAYFTPSYPNQPPLVNYHSFGLRINPNLYNCGKVCLSLLGTWSGHGKENWLPGTSTMLQVLVSIQGLILNAEPYFNEPGYVSSKNTAHGKKGSDNYSDNAFLLSLKTMLNTLRNPPKHFEDLVYGHFYKRAHDILAACTAYLNGARVGSFEKGKTQITNGKKSSKTCSQILMASLPTYIKSLVEAFTKIGVKDCEKYLAPAENGASQTAVGGSSRSRKKSKYT